MVSIAPVRLVTSRPPTESGVMRAVTPLDRTGRVLLVDDEPLVSAAFRRTLERRHEVVVTNNARAALARVLAGESFDVILCDINMPDMTGVEFYRELCRIAPIQGRRTVFLTGDAEAPLARDFLRQHDSLFVQKPVDMLALRNLVARAVEEARLGDQHALQEKTMHKQSELVKEAVGWVAWEIGSRSRAGRACLAPIGLRTKQRWYEGRVGAVELASGDSVVLGSLDANYMTFELFWKGWQYYEPLTMIVLCELLEGASTFVDVGANVGYFSLAAAKTFPRLDVHAFEPSPKMAGILRANVARNALAVHVHEAGVSDKSGRRTLYRPPSDMSGSLEASFNPDIVDTIEVETVHLDGFADAGRLRAPAVFKIDAEGHEPAILRGARRLLEHRGPDLLLEVTEDYDPETVALLRSLGYSFYPIRNDGLRAEPGMRVVRQGDFLFLNTLVTRRSAAEVQRLSERVLPRFRDLDLRATCHHRPQPR